MGKKRMLCLLTVLVCLLTGCNIRTVDDLYCIPKRSESYRNLQAEIDRVMPGLEYSAPLSGDNQQTVQMADLDGDGQPEFLLFAKGNGDKPLRIFLFSRTNEQFALLDTIDTVGSAFERVDYVQMDDRKGVEIVVSRSVSDQVLRSVSIYTLASGQIEQVLNAKCAGYICSDLDGDGFTELLLLRPGDTNSVAGVAELYGVQHGAIERSTQAGMSEPAEKIKRIMSGKLQDGVPAVYVASDVNGNAIITDIYAVIDGELRNISFSNESGTSVQTLRNYYVYAEDIDDDGIQELPSLITMQMPPEVTASDNQYLIRWYSMNSQGEETDKLYTYHNFVGGWYVRLDSELARNLVVIQQGNSYEFAVWDAEGKTTQLVFTISVLTGQKREEQAAVGNRFVLYRTESTVYAADLEVASATYQISREDLIKSFCLIMQEWITGET